MTKRKTEDYVFKIPRLRSKAYDLFTLLIIFINVILFAGFFYSMPDTSQKIIAAFGVFVVLFFIILGKIFREKYKKPFALKASVIFISATWAILDFFIPAALMLILLGFYLLAKRELVILINSDRIFYPSFPSRQILWSELNNVILKDGLITIDFKSNKLIQQTIADQQEPADEWEFNAFCRRQLLNKKN